MDFKNSDSNSTGSSGVHSYDNRNGKKRAKSDSMIVVFSKSDSKAVSLSIHYTYTHPRALKEKHKVELQTEALIIQTKQLRIRRKALDKRSEARTLELNDAFDAYAKRSCLELSKKIQKTFPREVRDIIYGYITGGEPVYISGNWRTTRKDSLRLSELYNDHWWNVDFVGTDMFRELVEEFFRSSCFQFGDDFEIIPYFRVADQWELGISPVSFICNVEVTINCYEDSWGNGIDNWDLKHKANSTCTELLVHLESLFGFRAGTAITIKINSLYVGNPSPLERQEQMCNEVLKFIFPVFRRLKDMNYRVRAILDGGADWSDPAAPFVSEWNPASHEAVTKAFWKVRAALCLMI